MIKATLFKIDGSREAVEFSTKDSLKTLQKCVGGKIEVICLVQFIDELKGNWTTANDLIINEEGLILDLPVNPWSSYVSKGTVWEFEKFRGDIVLIQGILP